MITTNHRDAIEMIATANCLHPRITDTATRDADRAQLLLRDRMVEDMLDAIEDPLRTDPCAVHARMLHDEIPGLRLSRLIAEAARDCIRDLRR